MAKKLSCPYCGQAISSKKKFREIVQRIEREKTDEIARTLADERKKHERRLAEQEREAERKLRGMLKQAGEEKRRLEAQAQKLSAEKKKQDDRRQALREKAKELATAKMSLRADIKKEMSAKIEEARASGARLQRRALQAEMRKASSREERLKQQVDDLSRRLSRKTPDEHGSWQEEDILELLQSEFHKHGDRISRVGKGRRGADVIQIVIEKGKELGTIVYESKNVSQWSNTFLDKATGYRRQYATPHVAIVSNRLPGKEREFCVRKRIPIVSPARAVHLARVLRMAVVEIGRLELSMDVRAEKVDDVYRYLRSADFKQQLAAVETACGELRKLQKTEKDWHSRHWVRQEKQHEAVEDSRREIDTAISEILEQEADGKPGKVLRMARG